VLWILVLIELVCIIALARQVGVLSVRIGPTGARTMNVGPDIGIAAPPILALDINGREVTLGTVRGRRTLLAFVSPVCSTCARVVRGLNALWHSERDLDIILVSNNDHDIAEVRAFAEEHHVTALPYVVSTDLSAAYQIQTTPYAVLVDADGIVRAKGLVNHIEHLESLLAAEESGHPTLEHLMHGKMPAVSMTKGFLTTEEGHGERANR
jgi:methylamine dehydrogenase accessory protein MauD